MKEKICQSCGMPLTEEKYFGTNQDGTINKDYCIFCFKNGAFTMDCTMDGMIGHCLKFLDEFNGACSTKFTKEEAIAEMRKNFPLLKRWRIK